MLQLLGKETPGDAACAFTPKNLHAFHTHGAKLLVPLVC
jgi:hypothetical protein